MLSLEINSHTTVYYPPVSGSTCRVFVCYVLMLNVSSSYSSHEGVTINFSAASHFHLVEEMYLTDAMMT